MDLPFAPGAHPQSNGPHEDPPASHVGRPHASHPPRLLLKLTVDDWSGDVLPDRLRPKGEPTEEESESEPTGKARRKGPRRRGR
jgi:hypothetical protein